MISAPLRYQWLQRPWWTWFWPWRASLLLVLVAFLVPPTATDAQNRLRSRGHLVTGPQSSITCPGGAVNISAGGNIQATIDANPAGTTYCLGTGTHTVGASILPKAGDTLIGAFGATLDGTALPNTDGAGVVSGWNCSACTNITVKNFYILGNDQVNCVGAYGLNSGGWTVEYNDMRNCRWAVNFGNEWVMVLPQTYIAGPTIRYNKLINNFWSGATSEDGSGAYGFQNQDNTIFSYNELSGNGGQSKFASTRYARVIGNRVASNQVGIWFDGDNIDPIIEGNLVASNDSEGIFCEISAGCIIRYNTVRGNGFVGSTAGIFISTSRDVSIYGNLLEANFRDVTLFVNCANVLPAGTNYATQIEWDLRNVSVTSNTFIVKGAEFDVLGPTWSYTGMCSDLTEYSAANNTKNNRFITNRYIVPSTTGYWWYWDGFKLFTEWQALGHDAMGTVEQG